MKILDRATILSGNKLSPFTTGEKLLAAAMDAELDAVERRYSAEVQMLAARLDAMRSRLGRADEA